jgi:uncharacterized membrane protein
LLVKALWVVFQSIPFSLRVSAEEIGLATLINGGRVSPESCGVGSHDDMVAQVCGTLAFAGPGAA